jgi:hypothetical protein
MQLFACPGCAYSPDGWGFCRYYQYFGAVTCEDYVIDAWTGRTGCILSGSCLWRTGQQVNTDPASDARIAAFAY